MRGELRAASGNAGVAVEFRTPQCAHRGLIITSRFVRRSPHIFTHGLSMSEQHVFVRSTSGHTCTFGVQYQGDLRASSSPVVAVCWLDSAVPRVCLFSPRWRRSAIICGLPRAAATGTGYSEGRTRSRVHPRSVNQVDRSACIQIIFTSGDRQWERGTYLVISRWLTLTRAPGRASALNPANYAPFAQAKRSVKLILGQLSPRESIQTVLRVHFLNILLTITMDCTFKFSTPDNCFVILFCLER